MIEVVFCLDKDYSLGEKRMRGRSTEPRSLCFEGNLAATRLRGVLNSRMLVAK